MKDPFVFSVTDPCSGVATSSAVVPGLSLASTLGRSCAAVSRVVSSFVAYASLRAAMLLKRTSSIAKASPVALLGPISMYAMSPLGRMKPTKTPGSGVVPGGGNVPPE